MSIKQYEKDLYAWAIENAELLLKKEFKRVDIKNIAHELMKIAKREKLMLVNHLMLLLSPALRYINHPAKEEGDKDWAFPIFRAQKACKKIVDRSPSLEGAIDFEEAQQIAIVHASIKSGMLGERFNGSGFTLEDYLTDGLIEKLSKNRGGKSAQRKKRFTGAGGDEIQLSCN